MNEHRSLSRLLAASKFAARKHASQRRKGPGDIPYINHPLEVAHTLADIAGVEDVEILIAAILHDTIEDTDTVAEEIEEHFGGRVLSLVLECTDDKNLPWEERKRLQVVHAADKSPEAKLIKMADKISNVSDLAKAPPAHWPLQRRIEYLDWTESVVAGLRGQSKVLDDMYDRALRFAREQLSPAAK